MTARRPTVVQVAERAHVSIATVSRVLNGKLARPSSTERVLAAAAELGYVPDATGRSLRMGRSLQIAFAVDDVGNPVYTEMLSGVEDGMAGSGSRLSVASTGHNPADLMALIDELSRGYADGLIISPLRRTPELIQALVDAAVPTVVVGSLDAGAPLDTVRIDSGLGVRQAYEHLVDTGRRRIAFVGGPPDTAPGSARLNAFRLAGSEFGCAGPVVQAQGFTVTAGEQAWLELAGLTGRRRPDAVLAANDLLALGVMRAAKSAGRRIPSGLAVAGIDDIQFARIFSPSLTSVSLKARERGRLAARLLLGRIAAPGAPTRTEQVEPELIIRESTS
ncbi:LacI family DNA-binding transcriptional regulator [Nakamurella lactea]|uniref:LacI family DNA-binding transcriptional regulator n=1 Tax=Nakamurella lactea TaxID=459515 RepID=UPI000423AA72|nr:LacI family DNA-binding transcriptional regulator [Nakamurella lactea]